MKTEFRESYHINPRPDIFALIPPFTEKVLDVGCGAGELGRAIKENKGVKEVVGIELNEDAAKIASRYLEKVFLQDINKFDLPYENKYFDCIICADILEHLIDPWHILNKIKKLLKDDGFIIVSIPNIRHIHTFLSLLRGDWDYVDRGIFDRTHLRFFTLKSITKSLTAAGYDVITFKRNYRLFENSGKYTNISKILSFYFFRDFFTFQYIIVAKLLKMGR